MESFFILRNVLQENKLFLLFFEHQTEIKDSTLQRKVKKVLKRIKEKDLHMQRASDMKEKKMELGKNLKNKQKWEV